MFKIVVTYGNMRGATFARRIQKREHANALLALALQKGYTDAVIKDDIPRKAGK